MSFTQRLLAADVGGFHKAYELSNYGLAGGEAGRQEPTAARSRTIQFCTPAADIVLCVVGAAAAVPVAAMTKVRWGVCSCAAMPLCS